MEYKNDRLGVSFAISDKITVRQQMEYDSLRDAPLLLGENATLYERLWNAAKVVMQDWQCAHVALDADLSSLDDPQAARAIEWASRAAFTHMVNLGNVEKNS